MTKTTWRWLGRSLVIVTMAVAGACSNEAPVAPLGAAAKQGASALRDVSNGNRLPDLTACPTLAAPEGSTLLLHAFGIGFQVYHWNGTSWGAPTPDATIYADAGGHGQIATHFAGPSWQSNSGSKVVGTVANRCTVDPNSIQWLSLTAVASGNGILARVNFIQRLNTAGGLAPATPGTVVGEEARQPYTADYLFYVAP